jgi:hypothetical protein
MSRLLAAAVVAMTLAPAGADAAPSRVVGCHSRVDFNLGISSALNMRCRDAASEMKRNKGSISYRFTTPHHFHCKRVSGTRLGGQWRCVRGAKAFRFEFGD